MADMAASYSAVTVVGVALLTFFAWRFFVTQLSWVFGLKLSEPAQFDSKSGA